MKYRWKTTPYRHQVAAVKKLLSTGFGGALLMEPRTGKTKAVIDYLSILHQAGKCDRAIIVAPLSVLGVWEDEFEAHSPCRVNLLTWDADNRKEYLPPDAQGWLNVLVVNYDAFSVSDSRSSFGRMALRDELREWGADAMVLDESHIIKSPSAKKTYAIQSTAWRFDQTRQPVEALIPYRVLMTGTPVTKKKRVFDIYSQWKFLNPDRFADLPTFQEFKHHYGRWIRPRGKAYDLWKGNRNIPDLKRRITADAFQVKREQCFDLPPRRDQKVPVQLTDKTRRHLEEMQEHMLTELDNGLIATASITLVQAMRESQITSGLAMTDEDRLFQIGSEKIDALAEIIEPLQELDEKVVIAGRFRADLQRAGKCARELGYDVYYIHGGIGRKDRDENIRQFRHTSRPAAMVIQPQAASLGIDLSTASTMVWVSLTTSYVDFTQACDRIALSDTPTHFYYLLAKDSVDEALYETLLGDGDVARAMLERYVPASG